MNLKVQHRFEKNKTFACIDTKTDSPVLLTETELVENYTSVKPEYVVSLKKFSIDEKITFGLIINSYKSDWDVPYVKKGKHGMEVDIAKLFTDKKYLPNCTVYYKDDIDKSVHYDNSETLIVRYGYYFTKPKYLAEEIADLMKFDSNDSYDFGVLLLQKTIEIFIHNILGIQWLNFEMLQLLKECNTKEFKKLGLKNIYNILLNFDFADPLSYYLTEYHLTLDVERFKTYFTPYNTMIFKIRDDDGLSDRDPTFLFGYLNNPYQSIDKSTAMSDEELSILLDFNKG